MSTSESSPRKHVLKVVQPYFDALADGSKTFEVRRNDRGFQKGDTIGLVCWNESLGGHINRNKATLSAVITYVYSGDPRFGPWPAGVVVLGLGDVR